MEEISRILCFALTEIGPLHAELLRARDSCSSGLTINVHYILRIALLHKEGF